MDAHRLIFLLHEICTLERPVPLNELARRGAQSPGHFHRRFRAILGETPKAFTQRLRLLRAASRLATSGDTAGQVALASGFSSHEVFTRAFQRQFGATPGNYRAAIRASMPQAARRRHFELSNAIAPCLRLFHMSPQIAQRSCPMPLLSIDRRQFEGQHLLLIRRRITRSQLAGMLAECFGRLFSHGQQAGLPIAGWPLARYVAMGPGLWTVEAAMPLAAPAQAEGEMEPGLLSAGPVVVGIHAGAYDGLPDTHAAIEKWIEEHGWRSAGAPWESYVTDPAQHPDPADWRTEVYWPIDD